MAFTMRTSKPGAGNKYYNNGNNGGWSWCVDGSPMDKNCNVLANCVGYACGRFNEIIGSMKYKTLCCNAENFIEAAKKAGLKVGNTPKLGAIMCWQKGGTLSGSDGAGHVAVVEKVYSNDKVYTSESAWNGSAFWNSTRTNSNGKWGMGSGYSFRGFIYNPAIKDNDPVPSTGKFKIGDKVIINGSLYSNSNAANASGSVSNKVTNITRYVEGAKHPYNTTGDLGWMNEGDIRLYEEPKPTPTPTPEPTPTPTPSQKYSIGTKVVINGALYYTSNSTTASGSVKNKTTYITRYAAGAKHPYNTTGDLGWMDEGAINAYSGGITYTVKKGDTLSSIAAKYGMTWQQVYARNKFVIGNNPNIIRPGQVLVIKD